MDKQFEEVKRMVEPILAKTYEMAQGKNRSLEDEQLIRHETLTWARDELARQI